MKNNQKLFFLIYAGLLSVMGLLASDMYLPALNQIQASFNTTEALAGISLSIYMVGFAFAQLFYGPLSDSIGRKPALLTGLIIFAIGTIGCVLAGDITTFLLFRLVQAIGVCAAYILWQPMIIDLFEGEEVQKIFAMLMALGALSPAIAPILGGFVADSAGWNMIFWILFTVTSLLILWTVFVFKESLPEESRSNSFNVAAVMTSYTSLAKNKVFLSFALTIALSITLYLVYLTIIPFVLAELSYSVDEIGLTYLPFAMSFLVGAQIAKTQYQRFGDIPIISFGVSLAILGSIALFMVPVLFPKDNVWMLIGAFSIITFANGFTIPTGMSFLIQRHAKIAGTCASAIGFLVAFLGFVSTAIASLLVDEIGVYAITTVIMGAAAIIIMIYFYGLKMLRLENNLDSAEENILDANTVSTETT